MPLYPPTHYGKGDESDRRSNPVLIGSVFDDPSPDVLNQLALHYGIAPDARINTLAVDIEYFMNTRDQITESIQPSPYIPSYTCPLKGAITLQYQKDSSFEPCHVTFSNADDFSEKRYEMTIDFKDQTLPHIHAITDMNACPADLVSYFIMLQSLPRDVLETVAKGADVAMLTHFNPPMRVPEGCGVTLLSFKNGRIEAQVIQTASLHRKWDAVIKDQQTALQNAANIIVWNYLY